LVRPSTIKPKYGFATGQADAHVNKTNKDAQRNFFQRRRLLLNQHRTDYAIEI
jgi:hypothetical protein